MLTEGVELGETRFSLEMLITLVLVFFLGLLATRWLQRLLRVTVLPRTRMDSGAQTALVTGIGYLGLTIAALTAVSAAGLNLASLAVVAGALSVGIGFGLQTIVSNFVSGIILLIERPIKEGDWIEVAGHSGYVRKIAVRSTRIETFDRHDVIVPNSALIAETVKNMTLTSQVGRLVLPVGVAYGSDLERTRRLLLEAARAQPSVLAAPAPAVLFMGLGENSLDFELRCYLKDIGDLLDVRSELLFAIYGTARWRRPASAFRSPSVTSTSGGSSRCWPRSRVDTASPRSPSAATGRDRPTADAAARPARVHTLCTLLAGCLHCAPR